MRPRAALCVLVLTSACSDYSLFGNRDEREDPGDTDTDLPEHTDTDTDVADQDCPEPDLAPTAASIDEDCATERAAGRFRPVVEWEDATVGDSIAMPVVGQLTDDNANGVIDAGDMPDIVVVNQWGTATALSGDGSKTHWAIATFGRDCPATPAIGDLTGDGFPEVVFAGDGIVAAFGGISGMPVWENAAAGIGDLAYCGAVGIYDLDADGTPEVVLGSTILDGRTGALRGQGTAGRGVLVGDTGAMSVAADIDADGDLEVVVGNATYDADGKTLWTNGESDGFTAVGDFDGDPQGEIVVSSWMGEVRLQDDDGVVLWRTTSMFLGDSVGAPAVADLDGDGLLEIGVAARTQYTVFEHDGKVKWQKDIADTSSGMAGSAVFDFEGDGDLEIVYADEKYVHVLAGANGAPLMAMPHSSGTAREYPVVADVDNDGSAEIVHVMSPYGVGTSKGLRVIGDETSSWLPARPIWNQHAYAITNVEDLGGIPSTCPPNWPEWNSFRAADPWEGRYTDLADALPLAGDLCAIDCDEGRLTAVARVGNGGTAELPAGVPVSLYARVGGEWQLVGTKATTAPIAPGETSEGLLFEVPAADATEALRIVADEGDVVPDECDEANNAVEVTSALCP